MPLNNVEKQDLPKFKWKLTDAKLDEESAKVSLGSLHLKSMNTEKEIRIADLGIRIVEQNLYWVTKNLRFKRYAATFQSNGRHLQTVAGGRRSGCYFARFHRKPYGYIFDKSALRKQSGIFKPALFCKDYLNL